MRSVPPTLRLSAGTLPGALRATPYLLVRVETGLPRLHRGLTRYFDAEYPGLFGYGTLPLAETRAPGWWDHHFRTAVGPFKGDRTGYFLFGQGEVVGHHTGLVRADLQFTDRSARLDERLRGQDELEWVRKLCFGAERVSAVDLAVVFQLIAYFDGVVVERQARAGFGDGDTRARQAKVAAVTPQPVAIPGASGDPFAVLKVPVTATQEEIRAAYKRQMKLHHPDKVAHMSEEIQAYAQAWTRVIRAAYEAITPREPER